MEPGRVEGEGSEEVGWPTMVLVSARRHRRLIASRLGNWNRAKNLGESLRRMTDCDVPSFVGTTLTGLAMTFGPDSPPKKWVRSRWHLDWIALHITGRPQV